MMLCFPSLIIQKNLAIQIVIGRPSEYSEMTTKQHTLRRTSNRSNLLAGFSLIEVLIAITIVGLLAAISYPSFQNSMIKSRRAEGKTALLDLQQRMERFFLDRNSYTTATIGSGDSTTDVLPSNLTENGRYALQISATSNTPPSYTIQAVPQPPQNADTECGTLTLNSQGVRGISGTGQVSNCW